MTAAPAATLVLHTGALGDFVLTWPILADLRRLAPASPLIVAGNPGRAELAGMIEYAGDGPLPQGERGAFPRPLADEILSIDGRTFTPLHGDDRAHDPALRDRLARFARVVSFLGPADCRFHRRLREVFAGELWAVDTRPQPGVREHIARQWRRQLPALAPEPVPRAFRLCEGAAPGPPDLPAGPIAVLHPGSGGRHKLWPIERFERTAERLAAAGLSPVLVVGQAELERGPPLPARFAAIAAPTLLQLAALLSRAAVFVGNDSGPTHLAAALGTPTVAVFVGTDPAVWSPAGPRVRVVGCGPPAGRVPEADEVAAAATEGR